MNLVEFIASMREQKELSFRDMEQGADLATPTSDGWPMRDDRLRQRICKTTRFKLKGARSR